MINGESMQKRLIICITLHCILTVFGIFLACVRSPFLGNLVFAYDSSRNPINIDFKFGIESRNELNTFNGTFTKDLIIDGTITTRLILSQEELNQIEKKLFEIGFFNYPNTFPSSGNVVPRADYYLKVQNGTTIKEVIWYSDSFIDKTNESTRANLNQLSDLIWSMIEAKLEYKLLPPANGAYQ